MNRKTKILIIIIVVVILLLLIVMRAKKRAKLVPEEKKSSVNTDYNQEKFIYRVVDEKTGEVLYEGTSEETVYLYQIDPDYRSSNPDSIDEYNFVEEEF